MPLGNAVQGAQHTAQRVTWTGWDLSSGTLSGRMVEVGSGALSFKGDSRDIDGTFTLVDSGSGGQFDWTYGTNDVADDGDFYVQFKNLHGDSTYDLSYITTFKVSKAI